MNQKLHLHRTKTYWFIAFFAADTNVVVVFDRALLPWTYICRYPNYEIYTYFRPLRLIANHIFGCNVRTHMSHQSHIRRDGTNSWKDTCSQPLTYVMHVRCIVSNTMAHCKMAISKRPCCLDKDQQTTLRIEERICYLFVYHLKMKWIDGDFINLWIIRVKNSIILS